MTKRVDVPARQFCTHQDCRLARAVSVRTAATIYLDAAAQVLDSSVQCLRGVAFDRRYAVTKAGR